MIDLTCGNCLELMDNIKDKSVDLILCDPPYGTTPLEWDSVIPFNQMWKHYNIVIKENGCILLFSQEPFATYLRMSNIENYKYDWCFNQIYKIYLNIKCKTEQVIQALEKEGDKSDSS